MTEPKEGDRVLVTEGPGASDRGRVQTVKAWPDRRGIRRALVVFDGGGADWIDVEVLQLEPDEA